MVSGLDDDQFIVGRAVDETVFVVDALGPKPEAGRQAPGVTSANVLPPTLRSSGPLGRGHRLQRQMGALVRDALDLPRRVLSNW